MLVFLDSWSSSTTPWPPFLVRKSLHDSTKWPWISGWHVTHNQHSVGAVWSILRTSVSRKHLQGTGSCLHLQFTYWSSLLNTPGGNSGLTLSNARLAIKASWLLRSEDACSAVYDDLSLTQGTENFIQKLFLHCNEVEIQLSPTCFSIKYKGWLLCLHQ